MKRRTLSSKHRSAVNIPALWCINCTKMLDVEGECTVFILTARLPRRKLAIGVAAAALLCCAGLVMNLDPPALPTVAASTVPDTTGISSNEERVSFLSQYGWQVNQDPVVTEELTIPKEMDESYDEYLALQSQQGFDLTQYAGKRVKRYTYEITNYPSGEQGVQANLLLYKNTVIGGEVLSPQLDGFLHGLAMP